MSRSLPDKNRVVYFPAFGISKMVNEKGRQISFKLENKNDDFNKIYEYYLNKK